MPTDVFAEVGAPGRNKIVSLTCPSTADLQLPRFRNSARDQSDQQTVAKVPLAPLEQPPLGDGEGKL